jgi:uncharacterized NAD(P)/FAD-binding protein YdhS
MIEDPWPMGRPMGRPFDIGIVGAGASAVCLLDALAQADDNRPSSLEPGTITVFDPSPNLWRGRPYQPDTTTVRVNSPPEDMSVRFGDSTHFIQWLAAHDLVVGSATQYVDPFSDVRFVPRAIFGDYLEQSARTALVHLMHRGWRVDLVREGVCAAAPVEDGVLLETTTGRRVTVSHAALCVGVGHPADSYGLTGTPGFLPEPYPIGRTLSGVDIDDEIAVIGTGLTAIDAVLALAARGHRGRISLLSRRGVLPSVRQRPVHHVLRHFTVSRFRAAWTRGEQMTLPELIAVLAAEVGDVGESMASIESEVRATCREHPVDRLRRQLAEVDSPVLGLRILQQAVPDTGPDVWPLLGDRDQAELLRTHYRTMMSLCCPMPPATAAKLLALIDSGQLELVSGVEHIEPCAAGGFAITTSSGEQRADFVVNAVSAAAHKVPPKATSLVSSLVEAELAQRHPRGGVHVDRATSRLTVAGRPDPRLSALGDLAAGSLFFTFGIPSLVDRAYDIVAAIHDHATSGAAALRQSV